MRIDTRAVSTLAETDAELVAVGVTCPFDRSAADLGVPMDAAEALVAEASRVDFDGTLGTSTYISSAGRWYALIGAGPSPKPSDYRRVGSGAIKIARAVKASAIALVGAGSEARARFATEGLRLGGYIFDVHKKRDDDDAPVTSACVVAPGSLARGVELGIDLSEAVCFARDLANEHPGRCTPSYLATCAEELASRFGFGCRIRDEVELAAEGFNLLLAVGRGSAEPSRLIHLTYRPEGEIKRRVCLVGKGVTYDSGGYSMKSSEHQLNMHLDMGGAAAVLGAAEAVGRRPPSGTEVHFIVPSVENLVSRDAYKVNEIIRGYNGTTVEVHNTDAEGRLILADALAYAAEQEPDEIVDVATLTGACAVALGTETAGVFCNDDAMAERLLGAAEAVDESMWRMPLTERIAEQLKSPHADTRNIGSRWGGAISAALFLQKFVGEHNWSHIDVAGPAMTNAEWEWICKGGTGFGVNALHEYARRSGDE